MARRRRGGRAFTYNVAIHMSDKNKEQLKAEFVLDVSTMNKQLDAASRQLTAAMKRATDNMARVMAGNTAAWSGAGTKIGTAMGTSVSHAVTRALAGLGGSITGIVGRIGHLATAPLRMLNTPLGMITGGVGAYGVVKGFEKVINAGRDLQSEQVQIQKTTNLTDSAIAHLTQRLIEFSNATGSSRSAMMGLAADAGRLGVRSTEDLEKFATTFIKAATATNVGPEMAEEVLRVMNSIGESVGNVDRLMSAVNELGNNLPTNERRILDFMSTMPGLNTILGLSTSQLLGFAAAASTTANEAGLVGTAMNNLATAMLKGISEGGKSLAIFSKTAGMSNEEWTALVSRDKNEALLRFIEGIKRTRDTGGDLISIFVDMGGEGARLVRVMMSLSQITDSLRVSQARAAAELQQNTSLTDEFGRRLNTVAAQQQRVTSALRNFFATLNDNKLNTEIFKTLADTLQNLITAHQVELAERFKGVMEKIARLVVGLPFDFEMARLALTGLFTEEAYMKGVLGNLIAWVGETLYATLMLVINGISATAQIALEYAINPIIERINGSIAKLLASQGATGPAARAVTSGMKPGEIMAAFDESIAGTSDKSLKRRLERISENIMDDAALRLQSEGVAKVGKDYYKGIDKMSRQEMYAMLKESDLGWKVPGADGGEVFKKLTDALAGTGLFNGPAWGAEFTNRYVGNAARIGERPDVQAQRAAENQARIAGVTGQTLKELGAQAKDAAGKLRKLADVPSVPGTKTQAGIDVAKANKQGVLSEFDKKYREERTSVAPLVNEFKEWFKKANLADAMHPIRTAITTPVAAQFKPEEWEKLDRDQRRDEINKYYSKNRVGGDVADMIGLRGGAQLYRRDVVNEQLRKALAYEQHGYVDKRGQIMNRFIMNESLKPGSGGNGALPGSSQQPIKVEITPEMSEVRFNENGEMRAVIKWRYEVMTATTAAAMTGAV